MHLPFARYLNNASASIKQMAKAGESILVHFHFFGHTSKAHAHRQKGLYKVASCLGACSQYPVFCCAYVDIDLAPVLFGILPQFLQELVYDANFRRISNLIGITTAESFMLSISQNTPIGPEGVSPG